VVLTLDYKKYFDSFDRKFLRKFPRKFGIPENVLRWTHDIYDNIGRAVKIGKAVGNAEKYDNGYGQGDPLSLVPALAFVSVQFNMVEAS
jgi:hypothetical protein